LVQIIVSFNRGSIQIARPMQVQKNEMYGSKLGDFN